MSFSYYRHNKYQRFVENFIINPFFSSKSETIFRVDGEQQWLLYLEYLLFDRVLVRNLREYQTVWKVMSDRDLPQTHFYLIPQKSSSQVWIFSYTSPCQIMNWRTLKNIYKNIFLLIFFFFFFYIVTTLFKHFYKFTFRLCT